MKTEDPVLQTWGDGANQTDLTPPPLPFPTDSRKRWDQQYLWVSVIVVLVSKATC